VAVELRRNAESLIDSRIRTARFRFLVIPTRYCVSLSAAVYTVLYDRHAKRVHDGLKLPHSTAGDFDELDHTADAVGVSWGG
jgi:hypothetical protein